MSVSRFIKYIRWGLENIPTTTNDLNSMLGLKSRKHNGYITQCTRLFYDLPKRTKTITDWARYESQITDLWKNVQEERVQISKNIYDLVSKNPTIKQSEIDKIIGFSKFGPKCRITQQFMILLEEQEVIGGKTRSWIPQDIENLQPLPRVYPVKRSSSWESIAFDFFLDNDIPFEFQHTLEGCKSNVKWAIADFKIGNVILEIHGAHHYRPVNFGGMTSGAALKKFNLQQARDRNVREFCLANGYMLIEIDVREMSVADFLGKLRKLFA